MRVLCEQEYDNEAEQAICDVAIHYTDTSLDTGKSLVVVVIGSILLYTVQGVPRRQSHRRSGLATLPSVGAVS